MARSDYTVHVHREDGEELRLDGLGLACGFFTVEADADTARGGWPVAPGNPNRIDLEDIVAMNATMRSRSKHSLWDPVLASDQRWLSAIPPALDSVEASDDEWAAADGDALLTAAIGACIRPGIGLAGATKMLHLKRPRFIPILDQLVTEMMGVSPPSGPRIDRRVAVAGQLATAIRREARRNVEVLQRVQAELARAEISRPLIRIFDAILWFSHPAAGVAGAKRSITVRVRP
jgi:hypothetical protein